MPENVTFQNYGSHRLRNRFFANKAWATQISKQRIQGKHFLEQSRTQETWKCKLNRKENRVKKLKEGPCSALEIAYTNCSAGVILWMKQSDKKVSFDDPQNGGHFSCRKPVSHVGTSTVSDSEALIHLAYVRHMWQSKFVVILEGLTRWKIELCSKMQGWGNDYRCILICMNAAGNTSWNAALEQQETFENAPLNGKENRGWKMDLKNGARIARTETHTLIAALV